ncbi:Fc.00g058460.m01.CDS01 [Cosmosporella sp. VM-42]
MAQNILITGASGYLGGTFVAQLAGANLPSHGKIYALVRNDTQGEAVKKYGLDPLTFDSYDQAAVEENVVCHKISVVVWLIDAMKSDAQDHFIKALAKVKEQTGGEVHFLHTSGAKIFSGLAGAPTDRPLLDNEPGLYEIQKSQQSPYALMQKAVDTNNTVIELAEAHGVRSYIFVPCIVYGEGQGFGNPISIQTVAIVKAAKAVKKVYRTDTGRPSWPVCHVNDNASLYVEILRSILRDGNLGYGKNGYYLAASGSVVWDDLYEAMAKSLAKRGVVDDTSVESADDAILEKMGAALGSPKEFVRVQLGGKCTFEAKHGEALGWKPKYLSEHIIEAADAEVELILKHIK